MESTPVEKITNRDQLLAMVFRSTPRSEGCHFLTPSDLSLQLGCINQIKGNVIPPHRHNAVRREIASACEVLLIKNGRLRVDFYDQNQTYLESRILGADDIVILVSGGHGFEALDDVQMIEVKQGPYAGELDRTRFTAVSKGEIKLVE